MRNSAGIIADGDQDRDSAGKRDKTSQGPYTQPETISTEIQRHFGTIRAGNTGHGFIKHLPRLRDHPTRNTAGDPAPIRKGHAAEKRKL